MMKIKLWLVIVSDRVSAKQKNDKTQDLVSSWCDEHGVQFVKSEIVADERKQIQRSLRSAIDNKDINLVITSGGTGFGARDVTPESTRPLLKKLTPGIDEYLRREGTKETSFAILTRGISGIVKNKIVINLPGNPAAVISGLDALRNILPHALHTMGGGVDDSDHVYKESDR